MSLYKTHSSSYGWLILSAALAASTAEAAIDISSAPLETGTSVPPNILFLLDDSGSMRWGFMPDDLRPTYMEPSNVWYDLAEHVIENGGGQRREADR